MASELNNDLSLHLQIEQSEGDRLLSVAKLDMDSPSVSREMGNISQYQQIVFSLLGVLEFSIGQAGQDRPEDLPMYHVWLTATAAKFQALADALDAASAPTAKKSR